MPLITETIVCAYPPCGQTATLTRHSARPVRQYCSKACSSRATATRNAAHFQTQFTESMNLAIRQAYQAPWGGLKTLWREDSRFAQMSYSTLLHQAALLGCAVKGAERDWTPEEDALLERLYLHGTLMAGLVRALKAKGWPRSRRAIRTRLWRLKLQRTGGDYLSVPDLAVAFHLSQQTVREYIRRHKIPVHHYTGEPGTFAAQIWIAPAALRQWILEHPILFSQLCVPDLPWLIGLLCPTTAGDTKDYATDDDSGAWLNGEAVRDVAAAD